MKKVTGEIIAMVSLVLLGASLGNLLSMFIGTSNSSTVVLVLCLVNLAYLYYIEKVQND